MSDWYPGKDEPIKSQAEADRVREYLVNATVAQFGCSREQAGKRIDALLKSNELDWLDPEGLYFRHIVDKYMKTPV